MHRSILTIGWNEIYLNRVQADESIDISHNASSNTLYDVSAALSGDFTRVSSAADIQLDSSSDILPDEAG
ncbi:unnamed protein product [Didymodactylos carnosus]|uniref:Uncharacterized protein n=1 Tax=Didymodactylos carnosus TaxID=1234261 RepID=A0A814WAI7_9BILA|nr:unnamed protein product [Didymodactylos carnosus]CAF1198784.1 unnamed protein product [Didymodactylos carnosus]CAF3726966.1 unnamed protein product [Didymodactylos carnosus]CAF3963401.1 unnamed protein product [Didymodactylos carnosus]